MSDPWAILLIHFSDDETNPFQNSWYEELFTEAGAGKWGLFDWFRDNSHGRADLTGSKVFGWYKLDMKTTDYKGSGVNPQARKDFVETCKQKARDEGVALDDFVGTVVVLNQDRDKFGGPVGAVGGDDGLNQFISGLGVGYMAQEMCHVYGLRHSKQLGSPEIEYGDQWDEMSGLSPLASPSPTLTARRRREGDAVYRIGPGLNAANMWRAGWLDESRTWTPTTESVGEDITLRPLHRRDLPGYLAARFLDTFIELRVPEGWDAGFGQASVFVHEFDQGMSWLVADSAGSFEWTAGSKSGIDGFSMPPELDLGVVSVRVKNIDPIAQTATLSFLRSKGKAGRQYFPEWWPKKKLWPELEEISPSDSFIVTPTETLRIPDTLLIRDVLEGIGNAQQRSISLADIERTGRIVPPVDPGHAIFEPLRPQSEG